MRSLKNFSITLLFFLSFCATAFATESEWAGTMEIAAVYPLEGYPNAGKEIEILGFGENNRGFTGKTAIFVTPLQLKNFLGLSTELSGYATTSALSAGLAGKYNSPTGSNAQYIKGDGTFGNMSIFATSSELSSYATSSALSSAIALKFDIPTGTASQYLRGDGTPANSSVFATSAQGAKADTALQSGDLSNYALSSNVVPNSRTVNGQALSNNITISFNLDQISDGTTYKLLTAEKLTKLDGIATGATANDTDANLKARANHTGTQAISTITNLQTSLDAKQAAISAAAHINDAATNGATNAATNAPTNLPTNYNTLSGLLGISDGLNGANSAQNDLAAKYNDLATKYNALAGKYNDLATRMNTLFDHLEAQGLQQP